MSFATTPDKEPANWQQCRNIIAYPHSWQYPAITEQQAYTQVCAEFPDLPTSTYIGFPWATVIDLLHSKQYERAEHYLNLLRNIPPDKAPTRVTVAQHVYLKRFPELFAMAGITDIFWAHATHDLPRLGRIRIHPFPLFPVRCLDVPDQADGTGKPFQERTYLYSFVGAYHPKHYLTKARQWIAQLPDTDDAVIVSRKEWFYEQMVYGKQIFGKPIEPAHQQRLADDALTYRTILQETIFSLCPSGSGPNSIRLWESLGFGCIPVIISDSLRLPGDEADWQDAAIFIQENKKAIRQLPDMLRERAHHQDLLQQQQERLGTLWEKYGHTSFIYDLLDFCKRSN
jgi:hypothetical protein